MYLGRTVLMIYFIMFPYCYIVVRLQCALVSVGVTGSYAGTGIQYVVPAALVYYGRKVTGRQPMGRNWLVWKDTNRSKDTVAYQQL